MAKALLRARIEVSGVTKLEDAALEALIPKLQPEIQRAIEYAKGLAQEDLVNNREGRRRRSPESPHYVDSFSGNVERSGRRVRVRIQNTHYFAQGLENGVKPHVMVSENPNTGRYWFPVATTKRAGGDYVFDGRPLVSAWKINHPGNKAYKILGRTQEWLRSELKSTTVRVRLGISR